VRLHGHLARRHVRAGLLMGPDPGIRLNLRLWRFAKSYLGLREGPEKHVFLQGQAYWVLANWLLHDLRLMHQAHAVPLADGTAVPDSDSVFNDQARAASEAIVHLQLAYGSWPYPLRERRHLKATIEGNWASLALLESYRWTRDEHYLRAALQWRDFLFSRIGFQSYQGTLAVNYFDQPRGNIPNNSTNTLWLLAALSELATPPAKGNAGQASKMFSQGSRQEPAGRPFGDCEEDSGPSPSTNSSEPDGRPLDENAGTSKQAPAGRASHSLCPEGRRAEMEEKIQGLLGFLHLAQRPNGEFPYILASPYEKEKIHYLCYQYNAFEFLDILHFSRLRPGPQAEDLLRPLAGFLETGMDPKGFARTSCLSPNPRALYYTAAVATALWKAYTIGLLPSADRSLKSLERLLDYQRPDGSFPYSVRDYGFLRDERSYPRYQAMILYFLCTVAGDLRNQERS